MHGSALCAVFGEMQRRELVPLPQRIVRGEMRARRADDLALGCADDALQQTHGPAVWHQRAQVRVDGERGAHGV